MLKTIIKQDGHGVWFVHVNGVQVGKDADGSRQRNFAAHYEVLLEAGVLSCVHGGTVFPKSEWWSCNIRAANFSEMLASIMKDLCDRGLIDKNKYTEECRVCPPDEAHYTWRLGRGSGVVKHKDF